MKIVRIVPTEWNGGFEVTYKMRTRGNKHYQTSVVAQDEMEAYAMVRGDILCNEEQSAIKNVRNFELLQKKFPNAGYERELRKARRMLKEVRYEIFGDQP